ncbi:N-acetylmuramoyl-L-alanine amidase [Clostridium sp. Maddingley MBC34-26]|nr:N-acetylmuramoyl-L-alanine amidase [Clostridium sp. Maddingley MBC34-26]EKQ51380.1 MAG: N-acetylmuramoyl-L-alanine amidase [Clostridium sp. Maddingley MBC34-26]
MIIGIDMGHPFNCGAFGIMSETDGNRAIGNLVISKLRSLGHTVVNCTYDVNVNELANRVALANAQTLDYFLSIHMDSFDNPNSNGVSIYTTQNSSAKVMAINIINKVAEQCGYYNRGLISANYYVLRNTNAPAMLIECGFVTNQGDCDRFNAERFANAIVEGMTGEVADSEWKLGWNKNSTGWWYCTNVEQKYYYKDSWENIEGEWYSFDSDGYARIDTWIKDNGKWYYLDQNCKMVKDCWKWIDGECYCFDIHGALYVDCTTPDGYAVDSSGAWIK